VDPPLWVIKLRTLSGNAQGDPLFTAELTATLKTRSPEFGETKTKGRHLN